MFATDTDLEVAARGTAFVSGHLNERADAFLIEDREGILLEDALLEIRRQELVAVVSEIPKVVWVRSLVPKLKNSASAAILSATMQARGSSIMVPTLYSTERPFLMKTSCATA